MKSKHPLLFRTAITVAVLLLAGVLVLTVVGPNSPVVRAQALVSASQPIEVATSTAGLQAESGLPRTVTVVGEGRMTMKPDIAQTNIGVEVVGSTVKATSSDAATTMSAVMVALKAQSIAEKDIQTAGYNVWVERPYGPEGPLTDKVLYHVSNNVMVTMRDLDKVGIILDAAIEAGANNIYGVTFSVAEPGQLMSEARQKAVADALSKANQLAEMNQVTLGDVVSVSEVIGGGGYYAGGFRGMAGGEGMGGGGGPISPGELEMLVQLQVTYSIE